MADYRHMWADLGMDLEKHDLLCEVLPDAFGGVFLAQQNRPEGMDFYDFVVSEIHGVRPAGLLNTRRKAEKYLAPSVSMSTMKWSLPREGSRPVYAGVHSFGYPGAKECCRPTPVRLSRLR